MVEHRSSTRHGRGSDGHHLLRSRTVAAELVRDARIASSDLVWEIGAGSGRLTAPLAERAGHVVAVERDPVLAQELRRRFAGSRTVEVVEGDAL